MTRMYLLFEPEALLAAKSRMNLLALHWRMCSGVIGRQERQHASHTSKAKSFKLRGVRKVQLHHGLNINDLQLSLAQAF